MSSPSDQIPKQNGILNGSKPSSNGDVFEPAKVPNDDTEAKQRAVLIEWMNSVLPNSNLPVKASSEELRTCLIDGAILLRILSSIKPGSVNQGGGSDQSMAPSPENVKKFLEVMADMRIPRFEMSDLEKGSMKPVISCLLALRSKFVLEGEKFSGPNVVTRCGSPHGTGSPNGPFSPTYGEEKQKGSPRFNFQRSFRNALMSGSEPSSALMHHGGHKFHEVFQMKQGRYADLSAAKISEMMKTNSLDNAPTQSLLSVVNGILDESIERKNDEIPHRVACLLRKVVQEIERRISTQAEHLRTQNNLFKSREEKFQSRINVLEALASGTGEERGIVKDLPQPEKIEKSNSENEKKIQEDDAVRMMKEKDQREEDVIRLMKEMKQREDDLIKLMKERDQSEENVIKLKKEKDQREEDVSRLIKEKEQREANEKEHRDENVSLLMKEKEQREEDVRRLMKEKEQREEDVRRLMKEKEQREEDVRRLMEEKEQRKANETEHREENVSRLMKEKEQREADVRRLTKEKEQREEDVRRLMEEKEQKEENALRLMKENEQRAEDVRRLMKEKAQIDAELSGVKRELERAKEMEEVLRKKMEAEAKGVKEELEERLVSLEQLLEESRNKVKVLEAYSASATQKWTKSECVIQTLSEFQFGALQDLRLSSKSIKQEVLKVQRNYAEEFNSLGVKFETLIHATQNYRTVLTENQKMYNELQDLKGNIRVYCRIRPFLPGQAAKQTTIEYIGENGEVMLVNPAKQGKDGRKMFRFNKAYGPDSTQAEVFSDTQPLIRSILDGYNVCIFAYGQTGSGKTYTMTGPTGASEEDWGVNYRALNDLFGTSKSRSGSFMYEVGVQMVEIYNEQVRDLLSNDASQKRLGIKSTATQSNGIAVPDASMLPVASTSDVIELMQVGLNNRSVSSTAMNERSSRSHSVVSVHVRGKDLHTGALSHGNLHLVDLAGSERVDRSEVTGDRLKEAQHINKSLSALGDVIFALAQKSSHVPYRNSKLTQLLQSSLGGQAKTLMFVQLNPDVESYSETFSTLKFAERVSGVELGAARSNKEGRDVKELMDQIATLKDTIAKKDDEIEELQLLKELKSAGHSAASDKPIGGAPHRDQKLSSGRRVGPNEKASSNVETSAEHSDNSHQTAEDSEHRKTSLKKSKSSRDIGQDFPPADDGTLDYRDGEHEERYSYQSDGGHSAGTEHDGSADEGSKPSDKLRVSRIAARIQSLQKSGQTASKPSLTRDPSKGSSSNLRKTVASTNTSLAKPATKGWR